MLRIFIDGDGCAVKEEVYRVAERYQLSVTVVANKPMNVPASPRINMVVVRSGHLDAADDWIAENITTNDIAITSDIPLAHRCLQAGARVLGPKGEEITEDSVGEALATRELMQTLRQFGDVRGGPAPMDKKDRSKFLGKLDQIIQAILRSHPQENIVANADEILTFWFSERVKELWFNSTPEFDQELRGKFESVLKRALKGELKQWQETAKGALALVIVLDQFPLNMYRGRAESYSTGDQAVAFAKAAIKRGFDGALPRDQVIFLYLPFMHSEKLTDQDRCVELLEKAGLKENLRFARHHQGIVRRFGRFPHRNAVLGRESTKDELDYLGSKEAFLG